jgi:hypothetical protein
MFFALLVMWMSDDGMQDITASKLPSKAQRARVLKDFVLLHRCILLIPFSIALSTVAMKSRPKFKHFVSSPVCCLHSEESNSKYE